MKEKIKPVGWLKTTKASKTHIPGIIRRETDVSPGEKIPYIINARSVLLYDPKLSAQELIDSLNVLKQDILLRKEKESSKK